MGGERARQAVLFADVCDSSRLYEELGDETARSTITAALDELQRCTERHGGRVVDRIGDEVMSAFPAPVPAARAAADMHRGVERLRRTGTVPGTLAVRVGFHWGEVLIEDGRLFGDVVYTARRMASLARREQVYFPSEIRSELSGDAALSSRDLWAAGVPGKRGRYEIAELVWNPDLLTAGPIPLEGGQRPARAAELVHGGESRRVYDGQPVVTFGRGAECDLVIEDRSVSRQHGRVEVRPAGPVLVDHSTNGTRVLSRGGVWRAVHRDEIRLRGSGLISLGSGDDAPVIHYRLLEVGDP